MIDVVLIDDEELVRASLRLLLREEGFHVTGEAHDGPSGLAMVERMKPQVVCLDIQMPGMDGLAVLEKLKSAWPEIGVMMITGSSDRESVNRSISLGAAGFIVKPFRADRVVSSMHALAKELGASQA